MFDNNKTWPFEEAKRIYEKIGGKTPEKGYVLFETGYGPSGLPHILESAGSTAPLSTTFFPPTTLQCIGTTFTTLS